MSVLFMFPGQGAQRPGMLHALPSGPEVLRTLRQTADILGSDPLLLDTAQALQSTVAVQLCLLIAGVAMGRVLLSEGAIPAIVAGLSVGAYPAAVVAGALEYADALRLVRRRAQLMESAYPAGYGMAAITGLDRFRLESLIADVHCQENPVYLANLNAPRQLVISGSVAALQAVMLQARQAGAVKAVRLAVNVPSHCDLFADAALIMQSEFLTAVLQRPRLRYLSASAARSLVDPQIISYDLSTNMARQVHWSETLRLAWEYGARLAVEMPGGTVLTGLAESQWEDGLAVACDTTRLDNVLALIARG